MTGLLLTIGWVLVGIGLTAGLLAFTRALLRRREGARDRRLFGAAVAAEVAGLALLLIGSAA